MNCTSWPQGMDWEMEARLMIMRILKKQNRQLLKQIGKTYALNVRELLEKYHTPQVYMPVFYKDKKDLEEEEEEDQEEDKN